MNDFMYRVEIQDMETGLWSRAKVTVEIAQRIKKLHSDLFKLVSFVSADVEPEYKTEYTNKKFLFFSWTDKERVRVDDDSEQRKRARAIAEDFRHDNVVVRISEWQYGFGEYHFSKVVYLDGKWL